MSRRSKREMAPPPSSVDWSAAPPPGFTGWFPAPPPASTQATHRSTIPGHRYRIQQCHGHLLLALGGPRLAEVQVSHLRTWTRMVAWTPIHKNGNLFLHEL
ncbi:unnamed protein product [Urochloa humidicola]